MSETNQLLCYGAMMLAIVVVLRLICDRDL